MRRLKRSIADRYELREVIGRGGMATIYRAHDTNLNRDVAVKVIRADRGDDATFSARFVQEARRAASISHPNVVAVYDYGTDGEGDQYIVMELIHGPDLATTLANEGRLTPDRAAGIGADVAAALEAAHRRGIVHRDVKPGNVLLTADGQVKVVDFGIALATDDTHMTATGTTLGSVAYFSPEQARGEQATAASDLYALGVVLYELLTGSRPFSGDSPYAIAVKRLSEDAQNPLELAPDLPPELVSIVMRALRRDPRKRPASAAALGKALRKWRANQSAAGVAPPAIAAVAAVTAVAAADTQPQPVLVPPAATRPKSSERPARERRIPAAWLLLAAGGLIGLAVLGFAGQRWLMGGDTRDPQTPLVGGFVLTPSPQASDTPAPPNRSASPTPRPITAPTAEPTPPPVVAIEPAAEPPAATPAPAAAALNPSETIAHWYDLIVNKDFDAAYDLWSQRMKANFERQGNLDGRWADTASVTINDIHTADQSGDRATVQIDFVETRTSGNSQRFIGYWELVRVDGRWLLDWPTF